MNEAFSRNAHHRRMYGQDQIYRTPVGSASNPKTPEATGSLVGNKIADKITSYSKKSPDWSTELHSNESNNEIPKER